MEDVLHSQVYAHLGMALNNEPYVVPITYAYRDGYLYGHTYDGKKIEMTRKNPRVCVQIMNMNNMRNWQSVICYGTFEELKGKEATEAIDHLVSHLHNAPEDIGIARPFQSGGATHTIREGTHPIVYRIKITEKSGRYERE